MNNDPYAASADFNEHYDDTPPRTSVLAIMSLVCSLICFIPGLSAIGSLLGVFALLGITKSNGKVKGTGLAVSGIAVGVIVSLLWFGTAFAVMKALGQFMGSSQFITEVDAGSYDSARGYLSTETQLHATDEALDAFKIAYEADAGKLVGWPKGLFGYVKELGIAAQGQDPNAMQKDYGNQQIPLPGIFDNGSRWVWVVLSQHEDNESGAMKAIINIGVVDNNGNTIWLVDPDALQSGAPVELPELPDADPADADPAEPDAVETPEGDG